MPVEKPLVYLILGARGSGRREILVDLIDTLGADARTAVLVSDREAPDPAEAGLGAVTRWMAEEEAILAALPPEATHVFFVADGARNPVDQIEGFKAWCEAQGGEVARVITVVNCQLAAQHAALLPWYEACIHFSDVVLLNRRDGVENKWLSDFQGHFKDQFYPCVFELVRQGRVKNPALVLDPQARRMSHVFDGEPEWIFTDADGDEVDEQEEVEDEDEIEAAPEEEPYFVRDAAGRRAKKIPDITKYLPQT